MGFQGSGEIIPKGEHTRLGFASLILGIIAVPTYYEFIFGPFTFGLLATIFRYASYFGKRKDSFGLVGFILGLISIIYGAVILVGLTGMR